MTLILTASNFYERFYFLHTLNCSEKTCSPDEKRVTEMATEYLSCLKNEDRCFKKVREAETAEKQNIVDNNWLDYEIR